jgi:hypothetical protein
MLLTERVIENTIFFDSKELFWAGFFPRDPFHGDFIYDRLWLTSMGAVFIFNVNEGHFQSYINRYSDAYTQSIFRLNGYPVVPEPSIPGNVRTAESLVRKWYLEDQKQLFLLRLKHR